MTSPAPAPPAPPADPGQPQPPGGPQPPQPQPPAPPAPPAPADPAPPEPADVAALRAALEAERAQRAQAQQALDKLQREHMTDQEKAIATARAEGRAEASHDAALMVAAAEFRVAAAGRLADPEAALAVLDLGKLLDAQDRPDKKRIAALVDQLAAVPAPAPPGGHIPGGPRQGSNGAGGGDWLRTVAQRSRS